MLYKGKRKKEDAYLFSIMKIFLNVSISLKVINYLRIWQ